MTRIFMEPNSSIVNQLVSKQGKNEKLLPTVETDVAVMPQRPLSGSPSGEIDPSSNSMTTCLHLTDPLLSKHVALTILLADKFAKTHLLSTSICRVVALQGLAQAIWFVSCQPDLPVLLVITHTFVMRELVAHWRSLGIARPRPISMPSQ